MSKNINERLIELYLNHSEKLNDKSESYINELREDAIQKFKSYGLPTSKDEKYKYSNICNWLDSYITDKSIVSVQDEKQIPIEQRSNGIIVCDINIFASEYSDIFEKYYTQSSEDESVMILSRAFFSKGRVVYIPSHVICDDIIEINIDSSDSELSLGSRDIFIFEKESMAKIHIKHSHSGVVNRVCEVFMESGANVEIYEEIYGTEKSILINTLSAIQDSDSFYKHISVNLSEGKVRYNEYVTLRESGSVSSIYGAVSAKGSAHIDNLTVVKHMVENCKSYENFKYIANDNSTAAFTGNIYVAPKANGTEAYQQNNNILLSDNANIYSKPNLEIYADDVKCSHGATVGQLDDNALFYMQQRGIPIYEAKKLLLKGFLKDIVDKISDNNLSEEVNSRVENNI